MPYIAGHGTGESLLERIRGSRFGLFYESPPLGANNANPGVSYIHEDALQETATSKFRVVLDEKGAPASALPTYEAVAQRSVLGKIRIINQLHINGLELTKGAEKQMWSGNAYLPKSQFYREVPFSIAAANQPFADLRLQHSHNISGQQNPGSNPDVVFGYHAYLCDAKPYTQQ